jgi:hypothetical protein
LTVSVWLFRTTTASASARAKLTDHVIRVGFNYRFASP